MKTAEDTSRSLIRSALGFFSGTMISRVSGMCRDISMAYCFGTDAAVAAFIVAFRFANLLRRIFGEGALLTSFIPHFESHRCEMTKRAASFFRDTFFSLVLILGLLISIIEVGLYAWIASAEMSENNREIVILTMVMLPSLLFMCLYSVCSGLLQCEKRYFLTGVAPIAFNIIWIAAVWYLRALPSELAMLGLAASIVFASMLQWLVTFPATLQFLLKQLHWREFLWPRLFSSEILAMLSSISLGVIGVSAAQINSAIDILFARYSALEGPAYLNFASHLQQLPLALFAISASSALLPPLSRAIKSGDLVRYRELLYFAISNMLQLLLPCSVAIFVLGCSSVTLIYGHGDFGAQSILHTTYCLWGYGIGLVPAALSLLLTPAFHAKKDFWTPTLASLLSIVVNISLNSFLVFLCGFGPASLAYATSFASLFNCVFLLQRLSKIMGIHLFPAMAPSLLKTFACVGSAAIITLYLGYQIYGDATIALLLGEDMPAFPTSLGEQLLHFCSLFGVYGALFLVGRQIGLDRLEPRESSRG